jgi:hypothetical protein
MLRDNTKPPGTGKRHRTKALALPPLTFEQTPDMLAPPVHVPEPVDEPEAEPSFMQAASPKPTTKPRQSRTPKREQ